MKRETIGQRIKRLREEQGLSQRELAADGVSYAYISRIEAGTRNPSVKALRKLAEKLGVTTTYLEEGTTAIHHHPDYLELMRVNERLRQERNDALRRVEELKSILND